MKRYVLLMAIWVGMALIFCKTTTANAPLRLYDLEQRTVLSESQAIQRLQAVRIVLVGEHHDNHEHHLAQLKVIKMLHDAGHQIAIGLEMFRQDSQDTLDQWIAGQVDTEKFESIYLDNWNYSWELYRPIFSYARENRIPLVGLNVSRKITAQVAYHGFASLNESQRGAMEGITCDVTEEYRNFIGRAYGAHGHGNMNFERFCEAQLVWDTAMAVHAISFLQAHPGYTLVILAGSGHARKLGIPSQLAKRGTWSFAVLLPETEGDFDIQALSDKDADFLLLNE